MKTCPECKSVYTDEALVICPNDGAKLVEENEGTSAETLVLNQSAKTVEKITTKTSPAVDVKSVKTSADPKPKGNSYLILVVAAVLGVLGMVWWFSQRSDKTTTGKGVDKTAINTHNAQTSNKAVPETKPPTLTDVPVGNAQSPSEAYRMLFAAVKSQDPAKIKSMLSKGSMGLAEMAAGQQKKTIDEVVKNGFSETTFADTYPQMRDERVKGEFGAVEVWNETRRQWDDIPFIMEDGHWKAAFGDAFGGKWKSPGKGQAMIEQENANANNPNATTQRMPVPSNVNTQITAPKKLNKPANQ